jgi:hypothetical protein
LIYPGPPPTFCETCTLTFDTFSTATTGSIIAGNLSSTCGPVTGYTMGWYLNGNYSTPGFISGYGVQANGTPFPTPFQHPLTGNGSVPVLAGNWEGIIHDIVINGVTYSSVSGSAGGQSIPFESCFDTVVAQPLKCDNGTSSGKYPHQKTFNSQAVGTTPSPVSLTYALDPTTKHFAYTFKGFSIWDEIEIKWKSGNPSATPSPNFYTQSIYLEKLRVGSDIPSANLPDTFNTDINNIWPKQANTNQPINRVLTLTNLETSSNPSAPDLLEIVITPNPANNNTQWKAGFQCLNIFDCTDCSFSNYTGSLPKISKIDLNKQYGCDAQQIILSVSGCYSPKQIGFRLKIHLLPFQVVSPNFSNAFTTTPGTINYYFPGWAQFNQYTSLKPSTSCTTWGSYTTLCGPSSTGSITFSKTLGQIQFTFNTEGDYLHYKNDLITAYNYLSTIGGTNITSSIPCPAGSTNTGYYRTFYLTIPIQLSATANCGDNTSPYVTRFHINDYFNTTYFVSPATNTWSITIPQTAIVNCYPQNSCDNCNSIINNGFILSYNALVSDPTTYSFTTTVGAKYSTPFGGGAGINRYISSSPSGSTCTPPVTIEQFYAEYSVKTIPFVPSSASLSGWVNLTTLSASLPCDMTPYQKNIYQPGLILNRAAAVGGWQIRYPNLTSSFNYSISTNDFEIYALAGFGPTGSYNYTNNVYPLPCPDPSGSKIYSYIGGVSTVYTSSYFVGGNPTLIIDP